MTLTLDQLRDSLNYDPETGEFTRAREASKAKAGDVAGHKNRDGYTYIRIHGKRYLAHRLAWFYVHGEWPTRIDHRDLNRGNNAIVNLRVCTQSQNMHNIHAPRHNTSGIKGVCFDAANGKWMASINVQGKFKNLGRYLSKEDAANAYAQAAQRHFGDFARTQAGA